MKSESELRRELLAAWKGVEQPKGEAGEAERQSAIRALETCRDERATKLLGDQWEKVKGQRGDTRKHLIAGLQSIAEAGHHRAFLKVAEISIEDPNSNLRREAAIWVGTQENRDKAIPIFARYLKMKHFAAHALESLGYTQICQHPKGPPDPDLVAGMIDQLVTVTPVRSGRTYVRGPTRWQGDPTHYRWEGTGGYVMTFRFVENQNENARQLLYQYTAQDIGFDQSAWRSTVLKPLRDSSAKNVQPISQSR